MSHLSSDQIVDLAEGTAPAGDQTHLDGCAQCRQQVAELRRVMALARDDRIPEPSPLFWDHFSERVRRAVADEPLPRRRFEWLTAFSWRLAVPVALTLLLAVVVGRVVVDRGRPEPVQIASQPSSIFDTVVSPEEEATWALLGDLTSALDVDRVVDEEIVVEAGAVERAVARLTSEEATELRRLLRAELGRPES
jgi:hypothetical protein